MARWLAILAGFQEVRLFVPRPNGARRESHSRALSLPVDQLVPGAWIYYRPRADSSELVSTYRFVAVVPPGVGVDKILTPDQIGLLDRHSSVAPTPRFARVVLGVPGLRRSIRSYRVVLMGTLASHGWIIQPDELLPEIGNRRSSPLPVGTSVSWVWHSSFGPTTCYGLTLAYIPAGESIKALSHERLRADLIDVSDQDRYLVRMRGRHEGRVMSPAAHLVERATNNSQTILPPDETSRDLSVVPDLPSKTRYTPRL